MKLKKTMFSLIAVSILAGTLQGCQKAEGPAEHAGKEIDKATETAGKEIDKAAETAGQKIEQAGEAIQDAAKGKK